MNLYLNLKQMLNKEFIFQFGIFSGIIIYYLKTDLISVSNNPIRSIFSASFSGMITSITLLILDDLIGGFPLNVTIPISMIISIVHLIKN